MKIRVITNHNYIDEIQSVAQIFFPHARFATLSNGENESPEYTITSDFDNGKVYAELFVNAKSLGKYSLDLANQPIYLNQKRLAMLAMYHLLQSTIGAYAPWGALTGVRPTKMVREWMASGQPDNEIIQNLQNTLDVHEGRAQLAVAVAHAENRLANQINAPAAGGSPPIGIYLSIPFCPSRCVYCSFNTANKPWGEDTQAQYVQAVISECREVSRSLKEMGTHVSSIYIGGGTPTALTDGLMDRLLSAIHENINVAGIVSGPPIEYTVEAGRPDTITRSKLQIMHQYGVNRISINPQTINDRTLEIIGRNHTTHDFFQAFEFAREEGFACINTDIIAGLPGEGPEDMRRTMDALAKLAPENITIHTLAVKRASKLNEHRTEKTLESYALPTAQAIEAQLQIAHEGCANAELSPYYLYRQKNMAALFENTGYSRPGHECLYNVGMMSEVQTVLGIGAGAVSKYIEGNKITRKFNVKNPEIYIQRSSLLT